MILLRCLLLIALVSLLPNESAAWSGSGHRIVAAIAIKLLPPQKTRDLDTLLRDELHNSFIDAASYADEHIRAQTRDFDSWHYVNWSEQPGSEPRCMPDCILNELPRQIEMFQRAVDPKQKALALTWILHLIGDIHQPLHVGDRNDRGGNLFLVSYRGSAFYVSGGKMVRYNLHHVWDDTLVDELITQTIDEREAADNPAIIACALLREAGIATYVHQPAATGTPLDWATEAHALAASVAYDGLQPGADLQASYIIPALATVREQLIKAGLRLAMVLDRASSPP